MQLGWRLQAWIAWLASVQTLGLRARPLTKQVGGRLPQVVARVHVRGLAVSKLRGSAALGVQNKFRGCSLPRPLPALDVQM